MGYHIKGGCTQPDCYYLHQEIVFSPQALADYKAHLAEIPCVQGEYCKYHMQGLCFHKHDQDAERKIGEADENETGHAADQSFKPNLKAKRFAPAQVYQPRAFCLPQLDTGLC